VYISKKLTQCGALVILCPPLSEILCELVIPLFADQTEANSHFDFLGVAMGKFDPPCRELNVKVPVDEFSNSAIFIPLIDQFTL
jgi:hypothetical protein